MDERRPSTLTSLGLLFLLSLMRLLLLLLQALALRLSESWFSGCYCLNPLMFNNK